MTNPVYLYSGESLLPNNVDLSSLIEGKATLPKKLIEPYFAGQSQTYVSQLDDQSPQDIGAGRIVKKTSESQSRWVINTAVKTWRHYLNSGDESSGLFLGLGTVDCDDGDNFLDCIADGPECLKDIMLNQRQPLICLALLNSSAVSHIAQLTGIKGDNISFSPLPDAGSNALIEGYFSVSEGRTKHALCGGGSQKVSPWHWLAYEPLWHCEDSLWFTDAASFVVLSQLQKIDNQSAESRIYHTARGRLEKERFPLSALIEEQLAIANKCELTLTRIIVNGCDSVQAKCLQKSLSDNVSAQLTVLEDYLGNTMAASTALACNLALTLLKSDLKSADNRGALIIGFGLQQKYGCLLIGACDE